MIDLDAEIAVKASTGLLLLVAIVGLGLIISVAFVKGEKRIERSKQRLRLMIETAPFGVIALHDGMVRSVNATAAQILSFKQPEALIGRPFLSLLHEEFVTSTRLWLETVEKLGRDSAGPKMDLRLQGDGITALYIEAHAVKIIDEGEELLVLSFQDVTDRVEAEDELRKLSRALEQSASAVVITGKDGIIEYVNSAFCKMTGYTALEVLGRTPGIVRSGHRPDEDYDELWATITAGNQWQGEFLNRAKGGDTFWVSASISPIRRPDGEITHYVAVEDDITRLKRIEEDLRHAFREAETANKSKSEFLANMSHELRTPLNAVIGFADILAEERFGAIGNKKYKEYAGDIRQSGQHLLDLINDILDVSRIEAGKLDLREGLVDVERLMRSTERIVGERVRSAELSMTVVLDDDLPGLWADELRMKQILLNLLGNAIKFTPPGGAITLTAAIGSDGGYCFQVEDTGIGIAPEDRERVFTPFGQVDGSLSRNHDGAGLGLPLSHSLIEMHGGTLDFDSRPGEGATFTARLPEDRTRLV